MLKKWLAYEFRVTLTCVCLSLFALIASETFGEGLPIDIAWVAILLCGMPIVINAVKALVVEHDIRAGVLVSIALIASLILGEYGEAGEVAVIMQIGGLLEDFTVEQARKGIGHQGQADIGKSRIVGLTDQRASYLVVVALGCAVLTGVISGEFIRAVTVLVVFCPCAFVLATPTAVSAIIGNLARKGIYLQSGDAVERLASVDTVLLEEKEIEVGAKSGQKEKKICLAFKPGAKIAEQEKDCPKILLGSQSETKKIVADAVLPEGDLQQIPYLFHMSRRAMRKVKQNIFFSLILNFTAILLSAFGVLTPATAALLHNGGSILVILNAATLLMAKEKA